MNYKEMLHKVISIFDSLETEKQEGIWKSRQNIALS